MASYFWHEPTQYTATGGEQISGIQYLWTDGHSSIWSRTLSLINVGTGISKYANEDWSDKKTFTYPGSDYSLTWKTVDGNSTLTDTVKDKQTATELHENVKHTLTDNSGDTYSSTNYYDGVNNFNKAGSYTGGTYSGGFTITFNGKNGTSSTTGDEISKETQDWKSVISYDSKGIRNENIKTTNNTLNYSNATYSIKWDSDIVQNRGVYEQINPFSSVRLKRSIF